MVGQLVWHQADGSCVQQGRQVYLCSLPWALGLLQLEVVTGGQSQAL